MTLISNRVLFKSGTSFFPTGKTPRFTSDTIASCSIGGERKRCQIPETGKNTHWNEGEKEFIYRVAGTDDDEGEFYYVRERDMQPFENS